MQFLKVQTFLLFLSYADSLEGCLADRSLLPKPLLEGLHLDSKDLCSKWALCSSRAFSQRAYSFPLDQSSHG